MRRREKKLFFGEKSYSQAREETIRRRSVLLRANIPNTLDLACKISDCTLRNPCGSGACHACNWTKRRSITWQAYRILEDYPVLYFVTLIPSNLLVAPEDLCDLKIAKYKNRLTTQIRRAGLKDVIIIGGVEPVYIQESGCMAVHAHLIIAGATRVEIEELRRYYPNNRGMQVKMIWPGWTSFLEVWKESRRSGETRRLRFRRLAKLIDRNRRKAISYSLKNVTGYRPKNYSFFRPPPPKVEAAHLSWLDQTSFEHRIILKGLRIYDGVLVLI